MAFYINTNNEYIYNTELNNRTFLKIRKTESYTYHPDPYNEDPPWYSFFTTEETTVITETNIYQDSVMKYLIERGSLIKISEQEATDIIKEWKQLQGTKTVSNGSMASDEGGISRVREIQLDHYD